MKNNFKQTALKAALVSALTFVAASFGVNSYAATQDANLNVSAEITANCTISTTPVVFGNYDHIVANTTTPLDATGGVVTTCTQGSAPEITLGAGQNFSTTRHLASGANLLAYELYTTAGRTVVWSATGVVPTAVDGTASTNSVFGRIPAGQNKPMGSYADVVVATVAF